MKSLSDDEELLRMLRLPADAIPAAVSPSGQARISKRRVTDPFVIAELGPLKEAAEAVADLGVGALMVWLFLVYEGRLKRVDTVLVSNLALAKWGVSRWVKYKALDRLEVAGLIEVMRRGKTSLGVRVVDRKEGNGA